MPFQFTDASGQPLDFVSIGALCAIYQRQPGVIVDAAAELGEQHILINGRAHYSVAQAERLKEHFRGKPRITTKDKLTAKVLRRRGYKIEEGN